jgi:transcriptional regulator with XRE-family HTH domain
MECTERLQLIRALNALSQQELADLVGAGRSTIALLENGHRLLPEPLAEALSVVLHVDAGWLTDEQWQKPLQGERLLIVDYPPRRILAAARNIRRLRLNDSISMIERLWPKFLEENPAQRCWVAETHDGKEAILLVVFKSDQGILFRLADAPLAEFLLDTVRKTEGVEVNTIEIDRDIYDGITRELSLTGVFFTKCGIGEGLRDAFILTAKNVLPAQATQVDELSGKTRRSILDGVARELMENNIDLAELADLLASSNRQDLIQPLLDRYGIRLEGK